MEENLIVTEKELNSFLNNLELKFIAQKLKIENVDKSIITLLKIVKNLQQENNQLKEDKKKAREYIKNGLDFKSLHFIKGQDEDMWKIILIDNIKQDLLRILGDKENE